jgi:uncharacterized protein
MARKPRAGSTAVAATAIALGAAAFAGVAALGALSVYVARRIIIPVKTRVEDLRVLGSTETTVTLSKTLDSLAPGRYGLYFSEGSGHARIGAILETGQNWVVRELIAVDHGDLDAATRGSIAGWFYLHPAELGIPYEDVVVETPVGPAPAWLIPADGKSTRWVIGVHGRGVRRPECLRAVEVIRRCGYNSLIVSYRNDGDAPHSVDGRYGLGDTEWRDVDAALDFVIARGATEVVLWAGRWAARSRCSWRHDRRAPTSCGGSCSSRPSSTGPTPSITRPTLSTPRAS